MACGCWRNLDGEAGALRGRSGLRTLATGALTGDRERSLRSGVVVMAVDAVLMLLLLLLLVLLLLFVLLLLLLAVLLLLLLLLGALLLL